MCLAFWPQTAHRNKLQTRRTDGNVHDGSKQQHACLRRRLCLWIRMFCIYTRSEASSQWPFIIVCVEVVEGGAEDKLGPLVKKLSCLNLRCSGWSSLTLASSMSSLMAVTRASLERKKQAWEVTKGSQSENTQCLQKTQQTRSRNTHCSHVSHRADAQRVWTQGQADWKLWILVSQ